MKIEQKEKIIQMVVGIYNRTLEFLALLGSHVS